VLSGASGEGAAEHVSSAAGIGLSFCCGKNPDPSPCFCGGHVLKGGNELKKQALGDHAQGLTPAMGSGCNVKEETEPRSLRPF
jgi:hypothetical protein